MPKDNFFTKAISSVPFWWIVLGLFAVEVASFTVFQYPSIQLPVFVAICAAFFGLSLYKLQWGVYIVLAELIIGSKGYLFAVEAGGFPVSIRLALFLLLFAASLVWMIRERRIRFLEWDLWKLTAGLVAVLGLGIVTGYLNDNSLSNIFLDLNGYLFLGLVIPITQALYKREHLWPAFGVLLAASVTVAVKTALLLVLFSQTLGFDPTLAALYKWVRDTGVGEITASVDGFPRIFFQSHVYMLFLFFIAGIHLFFATGTYKQMLTSKANRGALVFTGLALLVVFLGGSKSMWVGLIAAAGMLVLYLLVTRRIQFAKLLSVIGIVATIAVADFIIAYGLINLPVGGNLGVSGSAILTQRTSDDNAGAAIASRKLLLVPLAEKARESPVLGSGLGTTVTYHSEDPRAKEAFPEGYTTYAFEWGYLDLVVKFGLIGFAVFIWYFFAVSKSAFAKATRMRLTPIQLGLIATVLALYGTHFFTPYLNHPLGIGWLLIAAVAIPLFGEVKKQA